MTPRRYARYVSPAGEIWDTPHFDDDKPEFTDADGVQWRRTAITTKAYTVRANAVHELNHFPEAVEAE